MFSEKTVKIGKKDVALIGKFQLEVRVEDPKKFRMTNIMSFIPAGKTLQDKILFLSQAGSIESLFIEKVLTRFNPDKSNIDLHNVNVLVQHPNVRIGGMSDEEHTKLVREGYKLSNPKFIITNLDKVDDENHVTEVQLIKLRYRLYDDKNPLSKEQLIWLASNFGIGYRTEIQDETRYKEYLQKQIDKALQRSSENRKAFIEALDNMKLSEMKYYINEFLIEGILNESSNLYKLGNKPIGVNINSVIQYFDNNPSDFQMYKEEIILKNSNTVLST